MRMEGLYGSRYTQNSSARFYHDLVPRPASSTHMYATRRASNRAARLVKTLRWILHQVMSIASHVHELNKGR